MNRKLSCFRIKSPSEPTSMEVNRLQEKKSSPLHVPDRVRLDFIDLLPIITPKLDEALFALGKEAVLKRRIAELFEEWLRECDLPLGPIIREKVADYLFCELVKSKGRDVPND